MSATAAGQTFLGLIAAQFDGIARWFQGLFGADPAADVAARGLAPLLAGRVPL